MVAALFTCRVGMPPGKNQNHTALVWFWAQGIVLCTRIMCLVSTQPNIETKINAIGSVWMCEAQMLQSYWYMSLIFVQLEF